MKTATLLSAVLALAGGILFAHFDAGAAGNSCPPSKHIDATDAKTKDLLRGKMLVPANPNEEAETSLVQDARGITSKVSSRHFLVYDAQTGVLQPMFVKATCTSTCNVKAGGTCESIGCTALSDGSCTAHSCMGGGCTGGSCTRTTTAELVSEQ